jgi:hypothetical protein
MLRVILEDNRRERELESIMNKCVRYYQFPKIVCNVITITIDGITHEYQEMVTNNNKYVRYEAYYCNSYVLIKDVSIGMIYYIYGKYISGRRLSLMVHDILATGSNISLILENDENNSVMKKLIMKIRPNFGCLLFSTRRSDLPMNYRNIVTYDVDCDVDIYSYIVKDGEYTFDNILKVPGIGRIYKIMSNYINGI